MPDEKQHAHELIERLDSAQLTAVVGLLKTMVLDPVMRAIAGAPVDAEPLTVEEQQDLEEAREWLKQNEPIPHEQVLGDLGITQEEIDNYKEPA